MIHPNGSKLINNVDIAYEILAANGRQMYYYELIKQVLHRSEAPLDPSLISQVLTQINLDTRFAYMGKGEWGLRDWVPLKGSKKSTNLIPLKKDANLDEDENLNELDEVLYEFDDEEIKDGSEEMDEDFSE